MLVFYVFADGAYFDAVTILFFILRYICVYRQIA